MSDRFAECLAETLKWEGGYSNHPKDPGGATMKGVIQRVYDAYREHKGIARRPVKQIEDAELLEIYRENYWNLVRGDEIPAGLDLALFDFGVNSGTGTATGKLQAVLGVAIDHQMGPVTIQAACNCSVPEVIRKLSEARRSYVRQIRTYPTFGKGWMSRISGIEAAALAMAGEVPKTAPPVPIPDADAQSAAQGKALLEPVMIWWVRLKQMLGLSALAGTAYAAGTDGGQTLPAPPDLSAVSAWQGFGEMLLGLWRWSWHHPMLTIGLTGFIAILSFPKLWPKSWRAS